MYTIKFLESGEQYAVATLDDLKEELRNRLGVESVPELTRGVIYKDARYWILYE